MNITPRKLIAKLRPSYDPFDRAMERSIGGGRPTYAPDFSAPRPMTAPAARVTQKTQGG